MRRKNIYCDIHLIFYFFLRFALVIRNVWKMQKHLIFFSAYLFIKVQFLLLMMAFCVCIFPFIPSNPLIFFLSLTHFTKNKKKIKGNKRHVSRERFCFLVSFIRSLLFGVHFRLFFTVRQILCSKQLRFSIRLIKM